MMKLPAAKLADGFTATALHCVLPLVIWAAHFFLSYAGIEVACALDLRRFTLGGVAAPSLGLWIISAAAIAALCVLLWRASRYAKSRSMAATVRIGAIVLALVGVVWSTVAIVMLDESAVCRTVR